jgi:CRP/FNR family transcriptional regulator, cyclic AMP receptor protein
MQYAARMLGNPQEAELLRLLEAHEIMRLIPPEALRTLIRRAALVDYPERDEIFGQGDPGRTVLVVVKGYVKLSLTTLGGRELVLDLADPGSVIGEIAVLNDWPRAATATALSNCTLLAIDGRSFTRELRNAPEAMLAIIRLLSRRLRRTTAQVTENLELPAQVRLAKALIELAAMHSHPTPQGPQLGLSLSQRELGGMTGLIRESINRHLGAWRDAGWISLAEGTITLCDVGALRSLLSEHDLEELQD